MISQQQLYNELTTIARNHNLSGDSVELQKDWLSFIFANYSTEVTNAFKESSIVTATLMNDKITQCMSVMYPVYRGRNAKLFMNGYYDSVKNKYAYQSNTIINCDKYDLLYTSNNFYVYANEALNITQTIEGSDNQNFECIISTKPKYVATIEVTESNKYYIDVQIDDRVLANLSEDILIKVNGVETKTTRMFYEHIHQLTRENIIDYSQIYNIGDFSEIDQETKLFILTIPDYGFRIFKKGYFKVADVLEIQCFNYTTKKELVDNYEKELTKIKLDGFDMKVDVNSAIVDDADHTICNNYIIDSIDRDNINSLLYNATAYSHVQSQIMSNSDVDTLFTEYFRDYVINSSHAAVQLTESTEENNWKIYIYYIPISEANLITQAAIQAFIDTYCSYYISTNIEVIPVTAMNILVEATISQSKSVQLITDFESIFSEYTGELPMIDTIKENGSIDFNEDIETGSITYLASTEFSIDRVKAQVTKLPSVNYIKSFKLINLANNTEITDENQLTHNNNGFPVYLKFNYQLSYILE